jgi:hypothetical protein
MEAPMTIGLAIITIAAAVAGSHGLL